MEPIEKDDNSPNHWRLIRDIAVFQFKLALDGLRDLVLFPVSLLAGLIGVATSPDNPAKYFNQLLEFGRKSDVWINLFSASEHPLGGTDAREKSGEVQQHCTSQEEASQEEGSAGGHDDPIRQSTSKAQSSDDYLARLEQMLIDEYQKGGVVRNLKDRTDHLIERIQSETSKSIIGGSNSGESVFSAERDSAQPNSAQPEHYHQNNSDLSSDQPSAKN